MHDVESALYAFRGNFDKIFKRADRPGCRHDAVFVPNCAEFVPEKRVSVNRPTLYPIPDLHYIIEIFIHSDETSCLIFNYGRML
jgi:hypothetical protein